MSKPKRRQNFFISSEGLKFAQVLKAMAADSNFITDPSYSANTIMYPDHLIPFVNKHMDYISCHPETDPWQYLANLRLMTRVK